MRGEQGAIRRLLLLGLFGLAAWFAIARWWPSSSLTARSGSIQAAVNEALSAPGVQDYQILHQVHRERGAWRFVWVQTDRRIESPSPTALSQITTQLADVAKRHGCRFSRSDRGGETVLEIKKAFLLFQRLTFVPPIAPGTALAEARPQAALVIDDVGYDADIMDRFAALGVPLTFAILPNGRRSQALAEKAKALSFPVILHLPMEPFDLANNNPGTAALYLRMTPEQLRRQFEKDVADVPYVVGLNNHMGSAFTSDEVKMDLVMRWVKEKGLFFLDSRTSATSVVPRVAKRVGVPCLVNEVFLDNKDEEEAIERQLEEVMRLALQNKSKRTIAIGHYRRKFLIDALASKIPEFKSRGVQLVGLPTLYGS